MKLADFIYSATIKHNTSLGDNKAFPKREDVSFEYVVLKARYGEVIEAIKREFDEVPSCEEAENLLNKYLRMAMEYERPLRPQLEKLCEALCNNILGVPQETVILDCELTDKVEPDHALRIMPEDNTDEPTYTFDDVDEIRTANDAILKRRMMNSLVQGASYLLSMASFDNSYINEWSKDLTPLYVKIIALNDYLLFTKKEEISDKNPMLGAYVETHLGKGNEKTVISSQGLCFPLLLQETFRGFFELFASHGLPDDTKKAMYIIRHADFIMSEAWDLRMGVKLWELIIENIENVEESMYPYIFSSIAMLPIDEFNDMLQNLFSHTKKGKNFIEDIVNEVIHDNEYQTFKQDIEKFNMDKCVIEDDVIQESKNYENNLLKNKEGEPIKCYHSTEATFTEFDPDKINSGGAGAYHGYGFNFTTFPNLTYGKNVMEAYLSLKKPITSLKKTFTIQNIIQFMLTVDKDACDSIACEFTGDYTPIGSQKYYKNIVHAAHSLYDYADDDLDIYSNICMASNAGVKDTMMVFMDKGYDSAIEYNEDGSPKVVVVFTPQQIHLINKNQLTESQSPLKYPSKLSGTKVVNPDGSLKVMYRGDNNDINKFDRSYSSYANLYGTGFYFTDSQNHANNYGNAKEYYLNIQNPLNTDKHTITLKQVYNFLVAVDKNDDYGLYNYGYGSTPKTVLGKVYREDRSDFNIIQDINTSCIGDLVEATLLFNQINGTNFDGFILPTETVVFDNSQIIPVNYNPITEEYTIDINEKHDIIYGDEFKNWFGDWENSSEHSAIMSDIVDKDYDNSKPLLVWNSSPHKIKLGKHKSIGGEYLNGLHFSVMKGLPHGKNKCVCYLNMRNPYYAKKHSEIICPSDTLISKLKRSGCDGIIFDPWMYNDDNGLKSMDKFEFLVFDKSQVKVVNRDLTESKLMQLITEADSRLKKAETIIRNSFSGLLNPDGRVTSPEYYVNGNPETTWLQYILYSLRHTFDLMSNSDVKYIPSIARFAVGELGFETQEPKQDKLNDLMKIVQIIKSNPEKYSKYLNASSYDELEQTFAPILKALNDEENERINNASYDTNFGEYQIIEDADYETAKEFGDLSHPDSKLCYTQSESTWKDYTQDGLNKVYILLSQDWKNLQPEHTEDLLDSHVPQNETAYDRYGLSMIFVFVNQKNELIYCNTRWNHQAKYKQGCSTDHALTREDLSYIVRQPFMNVFKGYSDEELLDKGVVPFHLVQPLLDNGASLDDIFEKVVELPLYNVYIVLLHDKQNIVSSDRKLLFKEWYPSILRMNGFVLLCLESGAYQVATVNGHILSNKHEYAKIQFNTKIQCFMCYRRVGQSDEAQLFFVRKDGSYVTDKPCFGGYLSSGFFEPRIMDDKIVVSFKGMDSFTCNVLNVNTGKFMLEKNVYNIQIHETYSLIDTGSRKMICDKDLNDLFPNYNFRSVDYAGDIDNELIFFYCETYAGKYSIFSNQGKQITQVWFETPLSYLKDNKFKVKDNGNEFYIDLNGNIVN